MAQKTQNISTTYPVELVERLDKLCAERCIGRRLVLNRALETFLDKLEAQRFEGGPMQVDPKPGVVSMPFEVFEQLGKGPQ